MSPEAAALSALGLWLCAMLLLPKRGWRLVPRQLRLVLAGRRAHVLGPPGRTFHGGGVLGRMVGLAAADAIRVLELGVPLYLAALAAEALGRQRRQLLESRWRESPQGLFW